MSCSAISVLVRLINGASYEVACDWRRGERSAWALAWTGVCIHGLVQLPATWEWLGLPILVIVCVKAIRADLCPTHLFPRRIVVGRDLGRIVRAALWGPPVKPPAPTPDATSKSN